MPKNKPETDNTSGDQKAEEWIHSISEILHINVDGVQGTTVEDPSQQGVPNGEPTEHVDGPVGNHMPPEPVPVDLLPEIKKVCTKFEAYRKRRNVFKDVRDLEIFDNYVKTTAVFWTKLLI